MSVIESASIVECKHCEPVPNSENYNILKAYLPADYEYLVCNFNASNANFKARLRTNGKHQDHAHKWLEDFQMHSKCTMRVERTYPHSGTKNVFKIDLRCQHNTRPRNEKVREKESCKNTDCPAKMGITIKRVVTERKSRSKDPHLPDFPTVIQMNFCHNHDILTPEILKHRSVHSEVKQKILNLFKLGHNPASALDMHKYDLKLEYGEEFEKIIHDRALLPDFQYCYRFYNASVHRMDFVAEAELSTRAINHYFDQRTAGKASQMLSRIPSPSTNMLLLSALYFRGTLDMDIGTIQQEGRAFMRAGRARVRYGEHEYLNCTAVEVPFRGGLLSLLALLPREAGGMKLLERRLSAQRLADTLNSLQVDTVHFQMPRIVVGQTQGRNLTRALYELGLIDLFTPGHAHLFGISPFGWLHLTDVAHATYVEVRETEQEESARRHSASASEDSTKIVLDRPFLWFVMDNVAGLIIAMGKMARPGTESLPA